MSEAALLFLDANALASPVTRTLLIAGARADGLRWTWSRHVEVEADRHARGQASRTSIVRKTILGTELSPAAQGMEARRVRRVERAVVRPAHRWHRFNVLMRAIRAPVSKSWVEADTQHR